MYFTENTGILVINQKFNSSSEILMAEFSSDYQRPTGAQSFFTSDYYVHIDGPMEKILNFFALAQFTVGEGTRRRKGAKGSTIHMAM